MNFLNYQKITTIRFNKIVSKPVHLFLGFNPLAKNTKNIYMAFYKKFYIPTALLTRTTAYGAFNNFDFYDRTSNNLLSNFTFFSKGLGYQ